ncbi:MAG: hypothetical protein EAZ92_17460 [Candidatus Kapaibacterium sp.]|nr:MAG: hypothetical protein EAZ92_17460 [Candidatus Kapabacteria bacterium]
MSNHSGGYFATKITSDILTRLYNDYAEGASLRDLSAKYRFSISSIYEAFQRNRLEIRPRKTHNLSHDDVLKMHTFYTRTRSLQETSEKFGVRISILRSQFVKYKLPTLRTHNRRVMAFSEKKIQKMHRYYMKNGYKATSERFKTSLGTLHAAFKLRGLQTARSRSTETQTYTEPHDDE